MVLSTQSKNKYLYLTLASLQYLKYYWKARKTIKKSLHQSKEEIKNNQFLKIKNLIEYVYLNVPYYKELLDNVKFTPGKFQSLEDIKHIPYLTKDILRKNTDKLISKSFPGKYLKHTESGGTTGTPIHFYLDKRTSSPVEMAYLNNIWSRFGFSLFDRTIVLRGQTFPVIENKKYWEMNRTINWLTLSSFHINDNTFEIYREKINSFRPKFFIAYPSSIYLLARLYERFSSVLPDSVKAIIFSSENVYEQQRKYIEKILKVKTFSYYGLSEKCCIAAETENSTHYDFAPYYGFVEIVNDNDEWCTQDNEKGEIVATSFNNYAMPFIRYKTGDIAIFKKGYANQNRPWTSIKKIEGRIQDFIVDKNNNLLTFTCHDEPINHIKDKINAYQFIQNEMGIINILLENSQNIEKNELMKVQNELSDIFKNFDFNFEFVTKIPRTSSGKFKYLIQNLKITDYKKL